MFTTLLIVIAIPTLILTSSVFLLARRQLVQSAVAQNFITADLMANLIDEDFFGLRRYVEAIARRAVLIDLLAHPGAAQPEEVLKGVVEENKKIFRAEIVDLSGRIVADYPHPPEVPAENVKTREWFAGARKFDAPYVSNVHESSGPGNPDVITVAQRVHDNHGKVLGFLAAQYAVSNLNNAIELIKPSMEGGIAIFDRHNNPVNSSARQIEKSTVERILANKGAKQIFWIGSQKYVGTHVSVPSVEWNVLAFQPLTILFEPLYELLHAIEALIVIVLLATAAIGWRWHSALFTYAAELRRSNEYLEGFCYSIAHDLHAPARAIRGFAAMLTDECHKELGAAGLQYVTRISQSGERMSALVNGLLDYGAIAHTPIHLEYLDPRPIIIEAKERLSDVIAEKKAMVEIAPQFCVVVGDRKILEKVFEHILSNALKFSKPSEPPIVKIWSEEIRGIARIWIEDNGIGIDPQYHQKIFGVFQTLHAPQTYSGTGIGLAITRKGLERLGGKIGLKSNSGQGSSFWIELPQS